MKIIKYLFQRRGFSQNKGRPSSGSMHHSAALHEPHMEAFNVVGDMFQACEFLKLLKLSL